MNKKDRNQFLLILTTVGVWMVLLSLFVIVKKVSNRITGVQTIARKEYSIPQPPRDAVTVVYPVEPSSIAEMQEKLDQLFQETNTSNLEKDLELPEVDFTF